MNVRNVLLVIFGCFLLVPPATPFGAAYFVFLYFYLRKNQKQTAKLGRGNEPESTQQHSELGVKKIRPDIDKTFNSSQYKKIQDLYR